MEISSATSRVAPDLLKALAILSDTNLRRFTAVDREDLKPYIYIYWKYIYTGNQKKGHIFLGDQQFYYIFTIFSKLLQTTERRLTGW